MLSKLHIIDISVIVFYLFLCLVIGFVSTRKINSIRDYALGGKYTPTFVLIGTFFATDVGAGLTVVSVERVYTMGLFFVVTMMCRPLLWIVISYVFGNRIEYFKDKGCLSISDIIEVSYGTNARRITNFLAFAFSIGILVIQITAMSYLFSYFLDVSPMYAALVSFGVLVTYSLFGGMRAVALTDVLQGAIFFIGIPLACYLAYIDIGLGYEEIFRSLPTSHTEFHLASKDLLFFISLLFCTIVGPTTDGPLIQRYLMASGKKQLREVARSCFYMSIFFTAIIVFIGYLIKAKAPDINPNTALFYLVDTYLPIGIKGLLVAGLLATIMSTADSWLNTASVLFAHDILKKMLPKLSVRQELLSARIFLLCISALASVMALINNGTLNEINWMVGNFWTPIVFIPIVAGFLNFSTNATSFLVSACTSVVGGLIGYHFTGEISTVSETLAVMGSLLGLLAAHYFQVYKGVLAGGRVSLPKRANFDFISAILRYSPIITSRRLVERHGRFYYLVGALGFVYAVGSLFLNGLYHTSIIITLNFVAIVVALLVCMHEYLLSVPKREKYMPILFHTALFLIFSLNAGYKLLLSNFDTLWLLSFVLSTLVVYFVAGFRVCMSLTFLGLLVSYAMHAIFGERYDHQYMPNIWYFILFISAIIFAAKNKEFFQLNEVDQREYYTKMIAHQVLQPVAQTSLVADHVGGILSSYVGSERKKDGKRYFMIEEGDFLEMKSIMDDFKQASKANEQTVKGLLLMSKDDIESSRDIGVYDIADCLKDALLLYNKKLLKRVSVKWEGSFKFRGSKMLIVEVLRNLIGNTFKYAGADAVLEIHFHENKMYLRDNGKGIDIDELQNIFLPSPGKGLGLPFCKRVMETFAGNIECNSIKGQYTEFVLTFFV